jgi:hypothetical protein
VEDSTSFVLLTLQTFALGNESIEMIAKLNRLFFILIFGSLGIMHLSMSGDFWTQLPTYFWPSEKVTVIGHSLRMNPSGNGPMGDVTFRTLASEHRSYTDRLSQKYDSGDLPARTAQFIEMYAPGTTHIAFFSPDGQRASLGHFPRSYSLSFAISGSIFALCSTAMLLGFLPLLRRAAAESRATINEANK